MKITNRPSTTNRVRVPSFILATAFDFSLSRRHRLPLSRKRPVDDTALPRVAAIISHRIIPADLGIIPLRIRPTANTIMRKQLVANTNILATIPPTSATALQTSENNTGNKNIAGNHYQHHPIKNSHHQLTTTLYDNDPAKSTTNSQKDQHQHKKQPPLGSRVLTNSIQTTHQKEPVSAERQRTAEPARHH